MKAFRADKMLNGALAGVAGVGLASLIGPLGPGAGAAVVGTFQNDATLQTIGGYSLGGALAGMVFGGLGGGGGGGVLL